VTDVTYLDAGVLIAHLDDQDAHFADSEKALARLILSGETFVTSAVTIAEALIRPAREGDAALGGAYLILTEELEVDVIDLDADGALALARARAENPSVKTPDAAVLATARRTGAARILTTDDRLARFDEAVTVSDFVD